MKFCSACGNPVEFRTPAGDHQPRHVCTVCGTVHYHNPKIIAGCVPEAADGRILMCRRAIEPRLGMWTFPAGFLELGESSAEGAARETLEESLAEVEVDDLFAVISVPYVSQVYLLHRGRMKGKRHGPTPESSETRLMREEEIPWDLIAFQTVYHGLKYFFEDRARGVKSFHELHLSVRPQRAGGEA
jgi:ADP-ribose pyrophosphatase YjhB (NUDIX family)